jgi:hypothetical protein
MAQQRQTLARHGGGEAGLMIGFWLDSRPHAVGSGVGPPRDGILSAGAARDAACSGGGDEAKTPQPGEASSRRMTLEPAGTVDGAPLGYLEYLPPGYGEGDPAPLLVFLHGGSEAGTGAKPRSRRSPSSRSRG